MRAHRFAMACRYAIIGIVALASAAPAIGQDFITFQSPSGNIHCYIATDEFAEARCDIIDFIPSFHTAPKDCELDWGNAFFVEPKGRGILGCVGDTTINPTAPVLEYGQEIRAKGFTCRSETSGMTCTNATGGGFAVSRASQCLF